MEITRKIIIIPNETIINIPTYNRNLNEDETYGLGLKEFSDKYNLGLKENDYHDINCFTEMAKQGYLIIRQDENIFVYLPPIITEQQYRYLLERKNDFYKYKNNIYAHSIYYEDGNFYENGLNNLMMEHKEIKVEMLYNEIDKKYIPNKDSFILIIPDEEQLQIENGIYFKEFDTNIGHANMLQVFCMLHFLPIKVPDITGNPWAKELARNGHFVAKREKDELYLSIPRSLSNNQRKWLLENKGFISSFGQLEAGIYLEDGKYREIFKDEEHPIRKTVLELTEEIYDEINNKKTKMKRR